MGAEDDVKAGRPLRLWGGRVLPEWLDYNGHMTEHRYLQVFGEASDAFYGLAGVDFANAAEGAYFTLETHLRHVAECKVGTVLRADTQVLAYDEKRLHLLHRLFDADATLLATGEHLSIHVRRGKSAPASEAMLAVIARVFEVQKSLPMPERVGTVLTRPLAYHRA
ncbi:acyl-CoA thioester hydrolase/carnitine 3-dehydrogenase [Angulomicrobium tetraedrale]|uniref:Acyl-CoA thioester hydrolase/carnitine 3-dehydrogenase n=1 Tax=Ancylobacter tetraedralis TaxID=217068 RepID=A0A839ZFN3_9HYPH|nr:thioesterase family protein [Ancylobacter tetraedralis]MBB3773405.1 acyl-CoA thioester hydrolase/carnitine 3-dehydrogenase [Ancylobacter tetraedralis]